MTDVIDDPTGAIDFRSTITPAMRVLLLAGAAIPLIAPYELLYEPRWNSALSVFGVFAILISLGALAVSALLAAAALFGLNEHITLDSRRGVVRYACKAAVLRGHCHEFPMSWVKSVALVSHYWEDGPPTYDLVISIAEHTDVQAGPFDDLAVAERHRQRVEELIHSCKTA
jgi:hypothetical protein